MSRLLDEAVQQRETAGCSFVIGVFGPNLLADGLEVLWVQAEILKGVNDGLTVLASAT